MWRRTIVSPVNSQRHRALPHNANPWQTCYNRAMNKQMSLSALSDELSQVRTKKREFLGQYRTIRWQRRRCLFRHLLLADFSIYPQ